MDYITIKGGETLTWLLSAMIMFFALEEADPVFCLLKTNSVRLASQNARFVLWHAQFEEERPRECTKQR